jgi:hypothetical protein
VFLAFVICYRSIEFKAMKLADFIGNKTMQYDTDRAIAVLAKALAVCRGILYSARTGDASQSEIERLLESTGEESLITLMGKDTYSHAMQLSEALPKEDRDTLLSIGDDPY